MHYRLSSLTRRSEPNQLSTAMNGGHVVDGLDQRRFDGGASPREGADTHGSPNAALSTIVDLVKAIDGDPSRRGRVGIPGVVHEGRVPTVPNLGNWHEQVDRVNDFGDRLGVSVGRVR